MSGLPLGVASVAHGQRRAGATASPRPRGRGCRERAPTAAGSTASTVNGATALHALVEKPSVARARHQYVASSARAVATGHDVRDGVSATPDAPGSGCVRASSPNSWNS